MIQGAITFTVPSFNAHRLVARIAVYLSAGLLSFIILAWLTVFVVSLAFHLLLVACEHAAHLDIVTQILLILVLGYILKILVQYSVRGLRALFGK